MTAETITVSNGYDELAACSDSVSTGDARDRLKHTLFSALESAENTLVDAPTSLGKSHLIATTPWREYPEITGGEPVIHVHQTRDARDEAVERSIEASGVEYKVIKGREETCPVARGDYDSEFSAPDGSLPSEWFRQRCDVESILFSDAHKHFSNKRQMPCSTGGECPSKTQWPNGIRRDGEARFDVIHITAPLVNVPDLTEDANVIFDEQPTYNLSGAEITQLNDALNGLLHDRSDGNLNRNDLMYAVRRGRDNILSRVRQTLDKEVTDSQLFGHSESHKLTRKFGLALSQVQTVCSGQRRVGRYDNLSVVLNEKDDVSVVQERPRLSEARCVVGLDAFPVEHLWREHTVPDLDTVHVLSLDERQKWRREERGLEVVQLGAADRSYSRGWKSKGASKKADAIIRWLREKHGDDFRTCITTKALKSEVERKMENAGISDTTVLYYGNLKSKNDFSGESVGLLLGCIDPGDDPVLDQLALCGFDAGPEIGVNDDGETIRLPGRNFVGEDADSAQQSLASVRENNLAQAVGRYARKPDTDSTGATVYVWSAALPDSLTDKTLDESYTSVTKTRSKIEQYVQEAQGSVTKKEVATECDVSRPTAWKTLKQMVTQGVASVSEGTGDYGADEYRYQRGELKTAVEFS
ncbi:hypothetical protein [Haloferax sp. DFSO60]|uniref:hypothetical protein n=1 Tax=Haloferax sp. DFSO60 TaxID=3388652 RepID=UPI00397DBB55